MASINKNNDDSNHRLSLSVWHWQKDDARYWEFIHRERKRKEKKEKQTPQNQSKMSLLTEPKRHHILYYYFVENIPESWDIFRRKTCSYVVNGL